MDENELRAINLANWNDRVPVHVGPTSNYEVDRYIDEPNRLSEVVQFDRERLGDIAGKRVVHLQCHIGTDTLSLARLGADVTGVDFSLPAIEAARDLFARCETAGRFVESELYDTPATLSGETFDIVYTGVGAINWLPDIAGWAKVVASLLSDGGRLVLRDGHPALFVLDQTRTDGELHAEMSYFGGRPYIFGETTGTYADPDSVIENNTTVEWVHSISSIINGLIDAGLRIDRFEEFDKVDWKALDHMVPAGENMWALPEHQAGHLPLCFSIEATKA